MGARVLINGTWYNRSLRDERLTVHWFETIRTEVQFNLACLWFCKLSIEDKIPDHSVFCRPRREPTNKESRV